MSDRPTSAGCVAHQDGCDHPSRTNLWADMGRNVSPATVWTTLKKTRLLSNVSAQRPNLGVRAARAVAVRCTHASAARARVADDFRSGAMAYPASGVAMCCLKGVRDAKRRRVRSGLACRLQGSREMCFPS